MIREMQRNAQTNALFNTATYLSGPRGGEYRRDDTQTETDGQGHTYGKTRWYVYDGLGSVVGEVDPLGNLTSSPKYDVYGAVRANGGSASSRQGFVGGLGHVTDAETGLVYMRARYYDPSIGRFESQDPSADGLNWFVYCSNNPINESDVSGKAGKYLTDVLNMVKSDDAFYWGCGLTIISVLGAIGATDGSKGLALAGMAAGLAAAACFAIAFGANDLGAIKADLVTCTFMVMSIIGGAGGAGRLAAGAGSVATAAVVGVATYSLMLLGGCIADDVT